MLFLICTCSSADVFRGSLISEMFTDERSSICERSPAGFKMRVPEGEGMNHMRPDFQGHGHIGSTGRASKARGVCEQGLFCSDLD